ncbi:MAG: hypothetical protein P0S95_06135 [Rhabdochlamydiaceae bacterium]|nr:hypothetical protein [Candidatus Amphrikana amoebophyrae]
MKKIYLILVVFLSSSNLLMSKQISMEFEYNIVGKGGKMHKQIVLSDLFCNSVIYKTYKKSGKKLSFLDQNIAAYPIDNLEISSDALTSVFKVKLDSDYTSSLLPNFYESLYSIGSKGISKRDFFRVKMLMMETYYSHIEGKVLTSDAKAVLNVLNEMDYTSFCQYLLKDQTASRFKRIISLPKSDLASNMQNRGFTFASPIVNFAVGQHSFHSSVIPVGDGFKVNIPQEQQIDITYIITQMGTKSKAALLFSAGKLNRKGKNIENVPTLQFLAFIFHNPTLKGYMQNIRQDGFKWNRMIAGIRNGLQSQYNSGVLQAHLEGFSRYLGVDYQSLKTQMQHQNWDEFVAILLR